MFQSAGFRAVIIVCALLQKRTEWGTRLTSRGGLTIHGALGQ
ncbi:unnamed protein product [Staurois parvus]|uniref:Uncharacterized protein n=1 Tax=Staurois parvus TaxID=386267 RepID=A0ABN9AX57_9NEOB|nr:unnamed protein product [Staurois parvus]